MYNMMWIIKRRTSKTVSLHERGFYKFSICLSFTLFRKQSKTYIRMSSTNEKIFSIVKDPANVVVVTAIVMAYTSRSYYSRYFKRAAVPAVTLLVAYHSRNELFNFSGSPTILCNIQDSVLGILVKGLFSNSLMTKNKVLNRMFGDIIGIALISSAVSSFNNIFSLNMISLTKYIKDESYAAIMSLPFISTIVTKELLKEQKKLETSLKHELKSKVVAMGCVNTQLPMIGMSETDVIAFMTEQSTKEDSEWGKGKVSGSIYHGIKSHQELLNKAFGMYSLSNPLHPEIWPSAMKYDSEIIAMTASLVR